MDQVIRKIYESGTVVGRSGKIHQLQSAIDRDEGEFLFRIIQKDAGIVRTLEVGCAHGLSSLYICSALRDRTGVSHTIIDPFQNGYWDGAGVKALEEAGIDFFTLLEAGSEFALPMLLREGDGRFDFIFVDGFHTFDHTLLDCFFATRLLRVGGCLAIDDVHFRSVRRVVDFLRQYPCYEEIGTVGSTARKSWKEKLLKTIMAPIPRTAWVRVLMPNLYRRLFGDSVTRLIAFRKVAEDNRSWDWHEDAF
jgi:predicted O-methyltransferase YrrM